MGAGKSVPSTTDPLLPQLQPSPTADELDRAFVAAVVAVLNPSSARRASSVDTGAGVVLPASPAPLLPVPPLVELIVAYALARRCVVSTLPAPSNAFRSPYAVCCGGGGVILVADQNANCFRRRDPDGEVSTFAGRPFAPGFTPSTVSSFEYKANGARALCVDPSSAHRRYYLTTATSVHVWDSTGAGGGSAQHPVVSLVAGWSDRGVVDGCGSAARFGDAVGVVCTGDGATLYVCDSDAPTLRRIDTRTRAVTTLRVPPLPSNPKFSSGRTARAVKLPRFLAFDRTTPPDEPDSVLYVSCTASIVRFDLKAGTSREMRTVVPGGGSSLLWPYGLVALPSGVLLCTCVYTHSVYAFDPRTERVTRLAGSGHATVEMSATIQGNGAGHVDGRGADESRFHSPCGLAVDERDQSVIVADSYNRVLRRVTLPSEFFEHSDRSSTGTAALF